MTYESTQQVDSKECPGVRFTAYRMSFGRRLELTRQVRELLGRLEFARAGPGGPADDAEAALLAGEIDREYVRWGLASIEGLDIDGRPATPEDLIEKGPEKLVAEVLSAIRREAGLNEEERKNCESLSTSSEGEGPSGNATNAGV
ncbi:MAG: hypothetical protein WD733_15305 [Bryobacterales bacterium]